MFVSRGQLAKTALACVTSCMATDQWGGLVALLQGAQAALEGQQEPELLALADEMRKVSIGFDVLKFRVPKNFMMTRSAGA